MELQDLLNRYNLTIIDEPEEIKSNTKLNLISSDGYKYYLDKANLLCANRRNSELCKYFRNPYTEYNLSNFLMLETNGDVVIKDFQNAKNAHDLILSHCNSANIDYTRTENQIVKGNYYMFSKMPSYHGPNYKDIDTIKKEAQKYNVEIVSDYIVNNTTPIKFICNKHKDMGVQEKSWVDIYSQKYPCKYCLQEYWKTIVPPRDAAYKYKSRKGYKPSAEAIQRQRITTYENVKQRFEMSFPKLKNPFVDVVGEYKNAHDKIECKCLKCGEVFYLRPDHIKRGIGHSGCNKSLGEERLEKYLKEHNINYIGQYYFGDCVRKERDMPFDFYLPDLNIAIEYDGIQHYEPVVKFGGEEGFAELKLNDYFKTNYCAEHNIKLIRVPYTKYDSMEEFLNNYFNKD